MLQIRLLGQFDVRVDGKRVVIPSRAGQSLFAYLALSAGTPHRREKLAGILWPDTTDENARKNLRQELWRIRKAVSTQDLSTDNYLLADEFTITFNREADYWLDVAILERPDSDAQALTSSLALYRSELLPGFYEDWIILERERIQTLFETKMEQLIEMLVESERWTAVQEQCERWLALGNTPEPAYRALMLSYNARGDMAKVSAIYQRCVDDLRNQFGIEPSAETHALYNGLLKGARVPRRAAPAQPSGTVTFLFTNIEGSMHLVDKLGDEYAAALAQHHEILRAAIHKWKGNEVDTQGDSFFVSFARALDAVQCAVEVQRTLAHHKWPLDESIHLRMGLHTGEPLLTSTGYVGMDVHRAARIGDAGYGGQVLLSQTTRELVMHDLPGGIQISDLGEHRLKDMRYPIPIYQLVIDGLPSEFPPLKSRFSANEAPTPGEPPFKGLHYFEENDAEWFFGRELLTAKLVERLARLPLPSNGGGPAARILSVIIGASGSGKSSLVRAGLIPALKKGAVLWNGTKPPAGSTDWQIYVVTPTAHPLEALTKELTRDAEAVPATATLADDLSKEPRSLALFLARTQAQGHTLLVIDQFEELFTLCRDEFEREAFIDNLLSAMGSAVTIIITLRADFYAHLAQYPELRDAVAKQQEYIGPMIPEELRRAIEEPAKRGHWEFEPGLVDLILRDVGDEPGALPLLSHALLETWKRRAGHTLTLKGYADAGGVHGAIAHTAESVYQNLSPDEQAIARDLFLRLTELGEGTEDTRRRAAFGELMSDPEHAQEVRIVLNILADARLLTLTENSAEVAHEALIREWPTLREWLDEDREGLRLHRHLTEAAHDWELLERDAGALYRGAHLLQAREWADQHPKSLNEGERAFLAASIDHEQHEQQEREAQQQRELEAARKLAAAERARAEEQMQSANRLRLRNRVITTVGAVALVLAIIAVVFGTQAAAERDRADQQRVVAVDAQSTAQAEQERAEEEKRLATSRELAIAALNSLEADPELSILLALQSVAQSNTLESQDALHRAIQASRVTLTVRHEDVVEHVAYSPECISPPEASAERCGTRFATASDDGTAKIWDAETGRELLTLKTGPSASVAFSPDGKRLATANYEAKTATVWDAVTGQEVFTLTGHTGGVNQVVFSPDGKLLATASDDKTAKLWNAITGQELFTLTGHTDIISTTAFSPDSAQLVTGSWDHTAKLWDAATGKELLTFSDFTTFVEASFSPDGTRLAINSDNEVQVWDLRTDEKLFTLSGHTGLVEQVVYNADGTHLASASLDGTAKVWDAASGEELLTLAGHSSSFLSVAFSPDGIHLATASNDSTVRVWDISPAGSREWLTIAQHASGVEEVVYSPDGAHLATASDDGTAKVFNAATGKEVLTLAGHSARVYSIAFSPDGSRLATASEDNTAKIWDSVSGKELLTLSSHGDGIIGGLFPGIQAVAFRPDGKQLATVGADGNAILWDPLTGKQLESFSNNGIGITNVDFSPDGQRLVLTTDQPPAAVIGEDATAQLWDLIAGKKIFTATQAVRIWGLAFSNDGKRLATGGFGGVVKLRDSETGQELLDLSGHTGTVTSVAFSPDDRYLATASVDGTIKLWNAETGKEFLTLTGHAGPVLSVNFSPDGTRLVTSGQDGTVRVYLLKIEELVELAQSRVTRSLTNEECQRYLHVEQCTAQP